MKWLAEKQLKSEKGFGVTTTSLYDDLVKWLSTTRRVKSRETGIVDEEEYESTVLRRTRKAKNFLDTVGVGSLTVTLWGLMWPSTRATFENFLQHHTLLSQTRNPMVLGNRLSCIHAQRAFDVTQRMGPAGIDALQTILIPAMYEECLVAKTQQELRDCTSLFNMQ